VTGATNSAWRIRRLEPGDAAEYQALRFDGIVRSPRQFRVAPEDEAGLPLEAVAARLAGTYVAGGFDDAGLAGIGGLTRYEGAKLRHRGLLWGMYVHERARGRGLADELVRAILSEAGRQGIEQVVLTVVAENARARRLYQRWGFALYGVEPRAIRQDDGGYLDEALMACAVASSTVHPGG
jgi:ribosomal protein S18 acetylase RimI-like enzyme